MKEKDFELRLEKAIAGDETAIIELIEQYEPLINKYSRWSGEINDDLKQYIILRFLKSIKNFKI